MRRSLVGGALVVLLAPSVVAADEARGPVRQTAQTCQCRICEEAACCKAPTGFVPLDEKCRSRCRDERWTVAGGEACAAKPGCCR